MHRLSLLWMSALVTRALSFRSPLRMAATAPLSASATEVPNMDDLVSLCKRRGFVSQSSEIYNGFAGFWDYSVLGVELKKNIKDSWWRNFVYKREDVVGLDSSIIMSPSVWKASGHVDGFSDPMVDCKESKMRYRADQLFFGKVETKDGDVLGYVSVMEAGDMDKEAEKKAEKMRKSAQAGGLKLPIELKDVTEATEEELDLIPSPATGKPGSLTPPRAFNLMFQTQVGAMSDASATAYLRPETAQGIFVNFKNTQGVARAKVPFGIAQVGKAFRNEITPRNFIFRSREFEQMEIEYFIPPEEDVWQGHHEQWIEASWSWLKSIGLREDLMGKDVHGDGDLAHYARACTDITFRFPFGESELQGVAARGDYDLQAHAAGSGKNQEYFDEANKRKFVPHVIEPSIGVERLFLAVMTSAYAEDEVGGEKRSFLKFTPELAPVKAAVLPLVKKDPKLLAMSRKLYDKLREKYNVSYDESGAVGRRYRRADEIGVPFCVTVDFDSIEDGTVTVRDRDSTEQVRMHIKDVPAYIESQVEGKADDGDWWKVDDVE